MRVTVVGAGVIGLTSAIRLAEAGHAVHLVAAARTPHTTSDVAAAIHFPYLAEPRDRIQRWAADSLAVFRALAADPASGVQWRDARIVEPVDDPWWRDLVDGFQADGRLGGAATFHAFRCQVPVVAMPVHMAFLEAWALRLGVRFTTRRLARLADAPPCDVLVNATGLGARELVPDPAMVPIQGQVVRVRADVAEALLVESDPPVYAIPRPDGVVVGGTAVRGAEGTRPDPAVEADVLRRATAWEPRLAGAAILGRAAGVRPGRPTIRLDVERPAAGPPIVHCYGHGGSGVTLSWGCAAEVARLVAELAR